MNDAVNMAPLIEELNRMWLEAAREVAIADPKTAALTFDLTDDEVAALRQKSLLEIREGAKSMLVLFSPRDALRHWLKGSSSSSYISIVQALIRDIGARGTKQKDGSKK